MASSEGTLNSGLYTASREVDTRFHAALGPSVHQSVRFSRERVLLQEDVKVGRKYRGLHGTICKHLLELDSAVIEDCGNAPDRSSIIAV